MKTVMNQKHKTKPIYIRPVSEVIKIGLSGGIAECVSRGHPHRCVYLRESHKPKKRS